MKNRYKTFNEPETCNAVCSEGRQRPVCATWISSVSYTRKFEMLVGDEVLYSSDVAGSSQGGVYFLVVPDNFLNFVALRDYVCSRGEPAYSFIDIYGWYTGLFPEKHIFDLVLFLSNK